MAKDLRQSTASPSEEAKSLLLNCYRQNFVTALDRIDNSHVRGLAKYRMNSVKMGLRPVAYKKLTPPCVTTSMGHG